MTKAKKIQPLRDRVLLKRIEETEQQKGGIIIPDSAKEKPQEAEVVALGTGGKDEDGHAIQFSVKEGSRVLLPKYGGTEVKIDDETLILMRENEILAILS